jgi:hypothetical protein
MHENRETSEMPEATFCDRPAGEGSSRTARVHVFEESDSGTDESFEQKRKTAGGE